MSFGYTPCEIVNRSQNIAPAVLLTPLVGATTAVVRFVAYAHASVKWYSLGCLSGYEKCGGR